MTMPLAGITVVSLEQAVAAPFATRQLADLGARVIKIERPGSGDFARGYDESVQGLSSYFVWLNRSKESLTLDIKQPEGRAILEELLPSADIFVQNLAPGAAARLGLDAATLQSRYPGLITCDISGYDGEGPWRDRKAYDLLIQAEAGLLAVTGTPDDIARCGISIADISAGMYAFSGLLTSLYIRQQTGEARAVRVSLFDSLAEWMGAPAYYTTSGKQPARMGAEHATIAPYGPYSTLDGDVIVIAVQNDREWASFGSDVLGLPEVVVDPMFVTNSARVLNRHELNTVIVKQLAAISTEEAIARLERAKIATARVNSVSEFLQHPVLHEGHRWQDVSTAVGPIAMLKPPTNIDGVRQRMDAVPALGEHTEPILAGIGRSAAAIDDLRHRGVV
jgi:formyl-CoA transferase